MKLPNKIRSLYVQGQHLFRHFESHRISLYAAQASFFIVLSAIPFLMLTLQAVNALLPEGSDELVLLVSSIIPESMRDFALYIIEEISQKSTGSLLSLTVLTSVWSASKGIGAVSRGIHHVYGNADDLRGINAIIRSLIYTVAFAAVLIFALAFIVFGGEIQHFLESRYPIAAAVTDLAITLRTPISLLIFVGFFSLVYKALGGSLGSSKLRFAAQLPGALFTALGWIVFSFLYSLYIEIFPNFSYVYGSLAAVMLMMLWVYVCMTILLLGAEINEWAAGSRFRVLR